MDPWRVFCCAGAAGSSSRLGSWLCFQSKSHMSNAFDFYHSSLLLSPLLAPGFKHGSVRWAWLFLVKVLSWALFPVCFESCARHARAFKSVPERWDWSWVWFHAQSQHTAYISVWLVGLHSGVLWDHCTAVYLFWKEESIAWDASTRINLTSLHALAICADSSLGLGMYSYEVLRYIFKTWALGSQTVELLSWQTAL